MNHLFQLFKTAPRDYALALIEEGYTTKDTLLLALLKRMDHDHVRDALEANELDPTLTCDACDEGDFKDCDGLLDDEGAFTCDNCAKSDDDDDDDDEGDEA